MTVWAKSRAFVSWHYSSSCSTGVAGNMEKYERYKGGEEKKKHNFFQQWILWM